MNLNVIICSTKQIFFTIILINLLLLLNGNVWRIVMFKNNKKNYLSSMTTTSHVIQSF